MTQEITVRGEIADVSVHLPETSDQAAADIVAFLRQVADLIGSFVDGSVALSTSADAEDPAKNAAATMLMKAEALIYAAKMHADMVESLLLGEAQPADVGFPEFTSVE
jgi:hypothetical protein